MYRYEKKNARTDYSGIFNIHKHYKFNFSKADAQFFPIILFTPSINSAAVAV
jgi:hypothetical protein